MTKLDALNQIIKIILEGEKEGKTILSAINEAVKHFGGKGDAITNGQAINQLYEVFTGEKENLIPENIRKGVNILGVEGEDWDIEFGRLKVSLLSYDNDANFAITALTLNNKLAGANSFQKLPALQSLDVRNLDTSKMTSMGDMFSSCSSLTSLDLSNFDTSKVWNMYGMFYNCARLTSLDLSSFDTSQVTNMGWMFQNCSRLTSLTLDPNWASNNSITSFDLSSCPLTKESALDVLNKLADRTATTNKPTLRLKSTVKALLSDEEIKIATDKGWTVA